MRVFASVVRVATASAVMLGTLVASEAPGGGWSAGQPTVAQNGEAPDRLTTLSQPPDHSGGSASDATCDGCSFGTQVIADNFTVSTGGLGFDLQQIRFWGVYFPSNTPVVDDYEVNVLADSGGLPGGVVCFQHGAVPASRVATGVTVIGVDEYEVVINLASSCTLVDGTYWIEIYNRTGTLTDDWIWESGTTDATNGIAGSVFAYTAPGATWYLYPNEDFALEFNGVIQQIFADGFETGTTSAWSSAVP